MFLCFEQTAEVIVVVHQAVGRTGPVAALVDALESVEERELFINGLEDGFSLAAAGSQMRDCTGIFDVQWTGRVEKNSRGRRQGQTL